MCLLGGPVHAESAVCILPANVNIFGTPCTDAVNAYDGQHSLIRFDSCSGPQTVKVVFQQDPAHTSYVAGFQVGIKYDSNIFQDPACTLDPDGFFTDVAGVECPGVLLGYIPYVFGGKANISADPWPQSNPNFVLLNFNFSANSFAQNNIAELNFLSESAAKMTKVMDPNTDEIQDSLYPAHLTCGKGPIIVDNADGDDTARAANSATYDVDVLDFSGSLIKDIELRACSYYGHCGDLVDWTPLATNVNAARFTTDWKLPDAMWNALPNGKSYIEIRASDNNGANTGDTFVFYVKKQVAPAPPSGLLALSVGDGIAFSWIAPTLNSDGTPIKGLTSYNVYTLRECGHETLYNLNSEPIPAKTSHWTMADSGILPYKFYVATAINADGYESARSNCVTVTTQASRTVTGRLAVYNTSQGTVSDSGYPDTPIADFTIKLMNGDQEMGQAQTATDGSFLAAIPQGATATLTIRVLIPESSGYLYYPGTLSGGEGWRDAATAVAAATGATDAGTIRLGAGPPAGDFNCDGIVDITDAVLLKKPYGSTKGDGNYNGDLDLNGDEIIDIEDFVLLKKSYGLESTVAKPELCTGP